MKTINIGAKLARLHSGIGNAIMSLAMARGLDIAVAQAVAQGAGNSRSRVRGPKRPAGAKLRRGAHNGTLTVRHASATDQYWRELYASRMLAASMRRAENAINRKHAAQGERNEQ